MTKKAKVTIVAAVSAALLFGGAYVYFRNDIVQKEIEHELKPYIPAPVVLHELDTITADFTAETMPSTSEEKTIRNNGIGGRTDSFRRAF